MSSFRQKLDEKLFKTASNFATNFRLISPAHTLVRPQAELRIGATCRGAAAAAFEFDRCKTAQMQKLAIGDCVCANRGDGQEKTKSKGERERRTGGRRGRRKQRQSMRGGERKTKQRRDGAE